MNGKAILGVTRSAGSRVRNIAIALARATAAPTIAFVPKHSRHAGRPQQRFVAEAIVRSVTVRRSKESCAVASGALLDHA